MKIPQGRFRKKIPPQIGPLLGSISAPESESKKGRGLDIKTDSDYGRAGGL